MPRRRGLVNRQSVRSRFASEGYRTSREVLEYLDALVGAAIRARIRGMVGRGKTVTVEEIGRGRLMGDWKSSSKDSPAPKKTRKVTRGLLRR